MNRQTVRWMRGAQKLGEDGFDALVTRIEQVQHAYTRPAYAVLERIPVVSVYAQLVEQSQEIITDGVYHSIRATNHFLGVAASFLLDKIEERMD